VAADDCYQETWLAALRAYPTLRSSQNLTGWLFTVARSKVIDHGRKQVRRERVDRALTHPRPVDQPEEVAANGDVWAAVATLTTTQRDAVRLRYGADLSYGQIARVLDCSESAARQRVRAGLTRLREVIDHE
jgi:RNA polymerase sigma factor (sigma-70 family)